MSFSFSRSFRNLAKNSIYYKNTHTHRISHNETNFFYWSLKNFNNLNSMPNNKQVENSADIFINKRNNRVVEI